jgi:hypothetical protein
MAHEIDDNIDLQLMNKSRDLRIDLPANINEAIERAFYPAAYS